MFVCEDFVYVSSFVFVLLAVLFCLPLGMGIRRENTPDPEMVSNHMNIEKHFIDITSEYLIGVGGGGGIAFSLWPEFCHEGMLTLFFTVKDFAYSIT